MYDEGDDIGRILMKRITQSLALSVEKRAVIDCRK
jgi:hypothetical protein